MTNEQYQFAQDIIIAARMALEGIDLPAFIAAIDKADAIAPIIDPTLYLKGSGEMAKVRRLAQAALNLQECQLPAFMTDVAE